MQALLAGVVGRAVSFGLGKLAIIVVAMGAVGAVGLYVRSAEVAKANLVLERAARAQDQHTFAMARKADAMLIKQLEASLAAEHQTSLRRDTRQEQLTTIITSIHEGEAEAHEGHVPSAIMRAIDGLR